MLLGDDLSGRGIAFFLHPLRPVQVIDRAFKVRLCQCDRPLHRLERLLHGSFVIFADRQQGDLVVELRLKVTGLGLLDCDGLLAVHFLGDRRIQRR